MLCRRRPLRLPVPLGLYPAGEIACGRPAEVWGSGEEWLGDLDSNQD